MRVLTYTSYKEHYDLYTEINSSIAVNRCQIELAQKDIVLLSMISIIFYRASKHAGVEKTNTFINFRLSVGTYSIDDFNTKIKEAVSQQRQDWKPPQVKDLRLVIPEHYTYMTDNTHLVYLTNILKRLAALGQPYLLDHTKHPLIHHLLQSYYHCTVNRSIKLKTT